MNSIILYNNKFADGTLSVTDTATGYDKNNMIDKREFTFWKALNATGAKVIQVVFSIVNNSDAIGIVGHNLNCATSIYVESYNYVDDWIGQVDPFTVSDTKPILKLFTHPTRDQEKIRITISASVAPKIALLFLGNYLDMGFNPDTPYNAKDVSMQMESELSESGYMLGSALKYKPLTINPRFSNLLQTSVDGSIETFLSTHGMYRYPFLFAWDIVNFPADVFFVRLTKDAKRTKVKTIKNYEDYIDIPMEGIDPV